MAVAKTPQKKATQKAEVPSIQARIDRMIDYEGDGVRAIASVSIGGAFAIHGFKVYESEEKGLSVLCPANKSQKDGKYYETAHPVTGEARAALNSAVLEAYEQKLAEEQTAEPEQEAAQGQTM